MPSFKEYPIIYPRTEALDDEILNNFLKTYIDDDKLAQLVRNQKLELDFKGVKCYLQVVNDSQIYIENGAKKLLCSLIQSHNNQVIKKQVIITIDT
jgi:hypothetical protein